MIELLELCGFGKQEIDAELPRIEKTFDRLGITSEDIERAKQRLNKYYAVELKGIRKVLRLCVREVVSTVLAREEGKKKIVYGFMAPGWEIIGSALVSKSSEVYAVNHSWAFQAVLGCVFDKIVPILEAAEKKWLKAGVVTHCANVKTFMGLIVSESVPWPDMMLTSGFLCETAPKTLDLMHELYDIPVCCYDTCQDRELSDYSDGTKRAIDMAAKSLRRLVERVQEVVGFEITDEMLREVMDARVGLDRAIRDIRKLMEKSDPLPMGTANDNLFTILNMLTMNIDKIPEAVDAAKTTCEELQERVDKGLGVVEKGAPRILAMLFAQHVDPRLEHLAGEMGIAIVATDISLAVPYDMETKDPYVKMSMSLRGSLSTCLPRRIPLIVEGCKKLKVDGVLDRFHAGCRFVAGDAPLLKDAIEKEIGIPVLLLEWENFDPRIYKHEEYKRRLEVFKTMMVKKPA
jgi:benzoyl-CoA reductase/2-hydroxyglutaryl-CoA dehydratase subunit BcrC/BadD/HgdB